MRNVRIKKKRVEIENWSWRIEYQNNNFDSNQRLKNMTIGMRDNNQQLCCPLQQWIPSMLYLCTNVGRPNIQRRVLELRDPSLVNSNQILDTLQEDLFIIFLMLQHFLWQWQHTSLSNTKFTIYCLYTCISSTSHRHRSRSSFFGILNEIHCRKNWACALHAPITARPLQKSFLRPCFIFVSLVTGWHYFPYTDRKL